MEFWVSSSIKTPLVATGPSKVFLQLKQWVSMILSPEQKDLCIFLLLFCSSSESVLIVPLPRELQCFNGVGIVFRIIFGFVQG
jgi:hypothetical protein